ncbi:Crp/Fnr family transcriptional regulator [Burkholderiales bacterium GJ-E10]|nr:Crp/Fnr family transcriptional regulator [Burkholderiales bacterium GJ-E10]
MPCPPERTLDALSDPIVRDLAARGRIRDFAASAVLHREGDPAESLFLILHGEIQGYVSDSQGREMVLHRYGPAEVVGEMALGAALGMAGCDRHRYSACARTAAVCAVIDRNPLDAALRAHPGILRRMIGILTLRHGDIVDSVRRLALVDVYGRVRQLLVNLEAAADAAHTPRERLTHQDIANQVGASRDMVGRVLRDLLAGGYIAVEDRQFRILRPLPTRW